MITIFVVSCNVYKGKELENKNAVTNENNVTDTIYKISYWEEKSDSLIYRIDNYKNDSLYKQEVFNYSKNSLDNSIKIDNEKIYLTPQKSPEFGTSKGDLKKYLYENIVSKSDFNSTITPIMFLKVIINKDGTITHVGIERGINNQLNSFVIKEIQKMPQWQPAKNEGISVNSIYRIGITFRLY